MAILLIWIVFFSGYRRLAILCHGLEGSSESQYMVYTAQCLSENDWDVVCMNFRSCSGEMNRNLSMYHSGFTSDVHEVLVAKSQSYDEISLVGFSLGGNVSLKYAGDQKFDIPPNLKSIVAISVPVDLSKSSVKLSSRANWVYDNRFRVTLVKKMKEKHANFPDEISLKDLEKVKTLKDFDEYFTGPLHGFTGAEDYYSKCSSKQFLPGIKIPSLLITALDDPFLPKESYPFKEAEKNENFYFMAPKFGGHVGFTTFGSKYYWNEQKTLSFINNPADFSIHHKHLSGQL